MTLNNSEGSLEGNGLPALSTTNLASCGERDSPPQPIQTRTTTTPVAWETSAPTACSDHASEVPAISPVRLDYAIRALIRCGELTDALRIGGRGDQSDVPLRLSEAGAYDHAVVWDAVYRCYQHYGNLSDAELFHTIAGDIWDGTSDYRSKVPQEEIRDLIRFCYEGDVPDINAGREAIAHVLKHYLADRVEARAWKEWHSIDSDCLQETVDRVAVIRQQIKEFRSGANRRGPFTTEQFRQLVGERMELIRGVLVAGELAVVGAATKSLKTLICLDAAISIATGTAFLANEDWSTRTPRRAMFFSAESGAGTLMAKHDTIVTAKRQCMPLDERDRFDQLLATNILWDDQVPDLSDVADLARLERLIVTHGIEVVFADPLSMAIGSAAKDLANFALAGQVILRAAHLVRRVGATLVLVHHTSGDRQRNQSQRAREPLDLTDIGYTAVSNHARQWITLNRAEPYDEQHRRNVLWMRAGGSGLQAGGTFRVTITEGHQHDRWDVRVATQHEHIEREQTERDVRAAREEQEVRGRVLDFIRANPGCCRDDMVRETNVLANIGQAKLGRILPDLESRGAIRVDAASGGRHFYAAEPVGRVCPDITTEPSSGDVDDTTGG